MNINTSTSNRNSSTVGICWKWDLSNYLILSSKSLHLSELSWESNFSSFLRASRYSWSQVIYNVIVCLIISLDFSMGICLIVANEHSFVTSFSLLSARQSKLLAFLENGSNFHWLREKVSSFLGLFIFLCVAFSGELLTVNTNFFH